MEFGTNQEQRNNVKEVIEQKFSQIDGFTGCVEDRWEKVKERLLNTLNNDIDKMEIAHKKTINNQSNDEQNRRKKKSKNYKHQRV